MGLCVTWLAWLSGLACCPADQEVAGSIPSQDTCGRQPIDLSLSLNLSQSNVTVS